MSLPKSGETEMTMQKLFDLVYSGEKYTNSKGDEKTRFINVGAVFLRDDGSQCIKIETLPIGFTGWLNLFEPRDASALKPEPATDRPAARPSKQERHSSSYQAASQTFDQDDDVPF
jgi:hypothetical protein